MTVGKANGWAAVVLVTLGISACSRAEQTPSETAAPAPAAERWGGTEDSRIRTTIMARYQSDDAIRANDIDVTANDGTVTLRGTVDSEQARQQALTIARGVEGVGTVNDELQVRAAQADAAARPAETPEAPRAENERTPGWITTKIQAQYFLNPEVKPWNIDVTTTSDGVVTLRGEVDNVADRDEALRIARATDGVVRVEDELRVRGETAATTGSEQEKPPGTRAEDAGVTIEQPDAWVTAKVQAKYFTDDEVKGRNIDVDTQDGVVTLTGDVETEAERRRAIAIARNTDGVKDVRDQLTLRPAETPAPAESPARPAESGARDATRVANDTWITTKIQSKYFLDAEVKGHDINVDARNGVVTLKGTVETEQQKQMAAEIARETEGVARVVNELTVSAAERR